MHTKDHLWNVLRLNGMRGVCGIHIIEECLCVVWKQVDLGNMKHGHAHNEKHGRSLTISTVSATAVNQHHIYYKSYFTTTAKTYMVAVVAMVLLGCRGSSSVGDGNYGDSERW